MCNSNTTFVKVKWNLKQGDIAQNANSNTTFVKVKCKSTTIIDITYYIQIQHLLKLNSLQKFPLGSVYLIQIQHLLKLNLYLWKKYVEQ